MNRPQLRLRHLIGAASLSCASLLAAISVLPVAAQTSAVATPVSCPVLSVGNPNPGDTITEGGYVISGEAFDPAAQSGAGIGRVDLFLGERDQGGLFLGSAVPGSNSTNPRGWSVEVTIPSNFNRQIDFAAYAQSSVSGTETSVTFPVFVGTQPRPVGVVTPTPVPNFTATVTNNCPTTAPATAPVAQGTAVPAVSTTTSVSVPAASAATSACPTLSLANPNPGDDLMPGGLVISGAATENGAASGSGVQRVDLFLGPRDEGGLFLGSGVPGTGIAGNPAAFSVEVSVPSNFNRGVDFSAYAIGSNGQEEVVTFPVFVGTQTMTTGAPTPTPIPATQTVTSTCR